MKTTEKHLRDKIDSLVKEWEHDYADDRQIEDLVLDFAISKSTEDFYKQKFKIENDKLKKEISKMNKELMMYMNANRKCK
jgi:hypothetical protein